MYESRRFAHRKHFRLQVDPFMLAVLGGTVLLVCGILIGVSGSIAVEQGAAELAAEIIR